MLSLLSDGFDRFQWLVLDVFGSFFDSSVNTEKFISSQVGFFGSSVNTEEKKNCDFTPRTSDHIEVSDTC